MTESFRGRSRENRPGEASVMDTHLQGLFEVFSTYDDQRLDASLRKQLLHALESSSQADRAYLPRVKDLNEAYRVDDPSACATLHARAVLNMLRGGHPVPAEAKAALQAHLHRMERTIGDAQAGVRALRRQIPDARANIIEGLEREIISATLPPMQEPEPLPDSKEAHYS